MKSFFGALLVCAFIATVFGGGDPCKYFLSQFFKLHITIIFTVSDAFCDLPSSAGAFCVKTAPTTRYYYNGVTGACEEFNYHG